jgi:signal transduction histidine kinase
VQLDVDLPRRPPPHVEVAAYYVIGEALTNAVKHAAADRVTVRVRGPRDGPGGGDSVRIEVVDDGVGGVDGIGSSGGSGLEGLRDRVAALEGRLEVVSRPGEGTTVRAVLPCG